MRNSIARERSCGRADLRAARREPACSEIRSYLCGAPWKVIAANSGTTPGDGFDDV